MRLHSSAFVSNSTIPRQYTCEGTDLSLPLRWEHLPAGTQSLALIVEDPDAPDPAAPQRIWVHWVLYTYIGRDGPHRPLRQRRSISQDNPRRSMAAP